MALKRIDELPKLNVQDLQCALQFAAILSDDGLELRVCDLLAAREAINTLRVKSYEMKTFTYVWPSAPEVWCKVNMEFDRPKAPAVSLFYQSRPGEALPWFAPYYRCPSCTQQHWRAWGLGVKSRYLQDPTGREELLAQWKQESQRHNLCHDHKHEVSLVPLLWEDAFSQTPWRA